MKLPLFLESFFLSFIDVDEKLVLAQNSLVIEKEEHAFLKTQFNDLNQQNFILQRSNEALTLVKTELVSEVAKLNVELNDANSKLDALESGVNKYEVFLDALYPRTNLVYTKRTLMKKGKQVPYSVNVCDFVRPSETVKNNKGLLGIWTETLSYVTDDYQNNGALDYWQTVEETYFLRAGDCEDSSFYRVSKAKTNGVGDNLFVAIGFWGKVGHAFPIYIDDSGKVFVLEATSNEYKKVLLEGSIYKICYVWNERFCWEVEPKNFNTMKKTFAVM
jgi:hypothetical protein